MYRTRQRIILYLVFLIRSAAAADQSFTDLAKLVSSAIVSVQVDGTDSGSGVVVSPDGLIITSSTVLTRNSAMIKIQFANGQSHVAKVVATNVGTESALLRMSASANQVLPFLALADSSAVKAGSRAVTAGNPLDALSSDHEVAFSSGTVTRVCDYVRSTDKASRYCGCALETDAAINAGSEGGALLNEAGQMIGMTCMCMDRTRMRGCAVPSNCLRTAYEEYLPDHKVGSIADDADKLTGARLVVTKTVSYASSKRATSILPGTRLQVVTQDTSAQAPCICHCIVSAACRCDGTAVMIDARLNESDAGADVLNERGELVGTVSQANLARELGTQSAGVSFFTPISKMPATALDDKPLVKLIASCSGAFVFIGDGSGVVVSEDGLVLTNYHVAGSQNRWTVRIGGEQQMRLCDVVSTDVKHDLCLLKIRGIDHATFIKLGNSSTLKAAEPVFALGDPFKLGEKNGDPAASLGIISALHRNQGRYIDAIQTDCAINPGSSGGPLINMEGELVGLNGQIVSRYGKNNTGVAFAIPVDQIKNTFPALNEARTIGIASAVPRSVDTPKTMRH